MNSLSNLASWDFSLFKSCFKSFESNHERYSDLRRSFPIDEVPSVFFISCDFADFILGIPRSIPKEFPSNDVPIIEFLKFSFFSVTNDLHTCISFSLFRTLVFFMASSESFLNVDLAGVNLLIPLLNYGLFVSLVSPKLKLDERLMVSLYSALFYYIFGSIFPSVTFIVPGGLVRRNFLVCSIIGSAFIC